MCIQETTAPLSISYLPEFVYPEPKMSASKLLPRNPALSQGSFLTSWCIIARFDLPSCALPCRPSRVDLAIPWVGLQEGEPQQDPAADRPFDLQRERAPLARLLQPTVIWSRGLMIFSLYQILNAAPDSGKMLCVRERD